MRWLAPILLITATQSACSSKNEDSGYSYGSYGTSEGSPYGTIEITNLSSLTVAAVYISPCDDPYWSANLLSSTLSPSATTTFTSVEPDCYDVRAEDVGATTYWEQFGFTVNANETLHIDLNP